MTPREDLFELIKSLSKAEKRYFKLISSLHGSDKTYIKLFEAIEYQKVYDEPAIKEKFKGEAFIRQLSFTKNYLYNSILKSLEIFYLDNDVQSTLFSALRKIDILFKKNLLEQAFQLIIRYKKVAVKYQQYEVLNILLRHEMEYRKATFFAGTKPDDIKSYSYQIENLMSGLQNQAAYDILNLEVISHINHSIRMRSDKDKKEIRNLLEKRKLFAQEKPSAIISKYNSLISTSAYYFFVGDFKKAYKGALDQLQWLEDNKFIKSEKPAFYIASMHNKLICEAKLKLLDKFDITIAQLKEIKIPFPRYRNIILYSIYGTGTYVYIATGEISKGIELCRELELLENTKEFSELADAQRILIHYNMASIFFCSGEYSKTIKYLNKILNDKSRDERADIYGMSKLLSIFTHYEMGHEDLLSYITRSTYRYMHKNNKLFRFEKLILKFAGRYMTRSLPRKEMIEKLNVLKKEILIEFKSQPEKNVLEGSLFMKWIISKIDNKPIGQLLKESANNRLTL